MHDPDLVKAVRSAPGLGKALFDEPTRLGGIDEHLIDQTRPEDALTAGDVGTDQDNPKFLDASTELANPAYHKRLLEDLGNSDEEATRMASIDSIARKHPPPPRSSPRQQDERTRAVDIRNDPNMPNMNDVDWDID